MNLDFLKDTLYSYGDTYDFDNGESWNKTKIFLINSKVFKLNAKETTDNFYYLYVLQSPHNDGVVEINYSYYDTESIY